MIAAAPGREAPARAVLRALPRRPTVATAHGVPPRFERVNPQASLPQIAARGARWSVAGLVLGLRLGLDAARGKRSTRDRSARLRQLFEFVGGTAIKLGQQLSIRRDVLPADVCEELSLLTDKVPPVPWPLARSELETSLGRPLEEVFARIDPNPIGSASIATVYKGWLLDGTAVAIKVRRPNVLGQFSADIAAFDLFSRGMEAASVVRPAFFEHMRTEIRAMFMEELDLRLEARYQALFRKRARRALPWVVVPKVFRALSGMSVMVSAFVEARPMAALLGAVERQDAPALADYAEEGIDPERVAERIVLLSMWSRYESPFFHADPHPANLGVLPDSRILLLDFGACGVTSRNSSLYSLEYLRRMVDLDVAGITSVAMASLSPMPFLDDAEFRRLSEADIGKFMLAFEDPHAAWTERTSATLWLKVLENSQRYQIPMNLDILRMIRSTLLYDSVAFRLHRSMGTTLIARYLREAAARRARKVRRRIEDSPGVLSTLAQANELLPRAERAADRFAAFGASVSRQIEVGIGLLSLLALWGFRLLRLASAAVVLGFLAWGTLRFTPLGAHRPPLSALRAMAPSSDALLWTSPLVVLLGYVASRLVRFARRGAPPSGNRPFKRRYLS